MGFKYKSGDSVAVNGVPGRWRVWSAAPRPEHYWLKPADDAARALASTLKYGTLDASLRDIRGPTDPQLRRQKP